MRIEYIGMQDAVIVPDLERVVRKGEPVELETDEEVAVGKRLCEQVETWREVKAERPKAKAPASEAADTSG